MKKNLQRIVICFLVFIFWLEGKEAKAQWVTIPDANFVNWLNANGYANCMNGNLMDTTCNAVVSADNINIFGIDIQDLTGITYFDSLKYLVCANNKLLTLPTLPPLLIVLWCNGNQLQSLPLLPLSLTQLRCNNNNLQLLPNLPVSLLELDCSHNQLTALPALSYVNTVNCEYNKLTSLSNIPGALHELRCGHNQITNLPAAINSLTYLYCDNNLLTSLPYFNPGIQLLKELDCSYNLLTGISNYPFSLTGLYCQHNQITILPSLFNASNLWTLSCFNNQLTSLPTLPYGLHNLLCSNNPLTNLPALPSSLGTLHCSNNLLTSLPSLPSTIQKLKCSHNLLTNLPPLPGWIKEFDCSFNQITALPATPPNFFWEYNCSHNLIANLPVFTSGVHRLNCSFNQINSLPALLHIYGEINCSHNQITNFPTIYYNGNVTLDCSYNQISQLPNFPNNTLDTLNCSNNQITNIPSLPYNGLRSIECQHNLLTHLPLLPGGLGTLNCQFNKLDSLPSFPSSLSYLNCKGNKLTSLPALPLDMQLLNIMNNHNLFCMPPFKNIYEFDFSGTGISCLPGYGNVTVSTPPVASLPVCGLYNPSGCQLYRNITGVAFSDTNNDCVTDSNEMRLHDLKVNLFKNNILQQQTFTNTIGEYLFFSDTGTHTYMVDTTTLSLPVMVSCPASGTYSNLISVSDSSIDNKDFGIKCKPGFDVGVDAVTRVSGFFRPNSLTTVAVRCGDISNKFGFNCATGVSGTITVIIGGDADYFSSYPGSLIPVVNGDTLIYAIPDFGNVNYNSDIKFNVHTDTSAIIGSYICFDVNVLPTDSDLNPLNNNLHFCFAVRNSYDPNQKEVFPSGTIDSLTKELTYTIDFQNTGNAPAQNIFIVDTLDSSIDASSFMLLAYSHHPSVQVIGSMARFNFININLPDSVNNEPASHGFVQYKVRLKNNLQQGTLISNTAHIYFDLNTAIQTNTVITKILDCNNFVAINFSNGTFCKGDTLNAEALLEYPSAIEWHVDSIFNSNNPSIAIPDLSIGTHEIKLIAVNSFCSSEVISNVEIHALPFVALGNDTTNCSQYLIDAGTGNISYQWSNGETTQTIIASVTANYSVLVIDGNSCSSSDTIAIIINALPAKPTITQNISLLTSSYSAGNQWLMNGIVIAGATNNTYMVTLTGWYSVQVTDSNGCTNVSDSIYMDLTGVNDISNSLNMIQIIPNPTTSSFEVSGLRFEVNDVVTVTDALGKIVYQIKIVQPTANLTLQTSNYLNGVYFVNVKTGNAAVTLKLIKM